MSTLHRAIYEGNLKLIKELLDNGANIEAEDSDYARPLHVAIHLKNVKVVEFLISRKCDVNTTCRPVNLTDSSTSVLTALHLAVETGNEVIVAMLIRAGADPNPNLDLETPLELAAFLGLTKIANILIKANANVNKVSDRLSALHLALEHQDLEIARNLINHGANVNVTAGKQGMGPLHTAVVKESINATQLLITSGADVNMKSDGGETPLLLSIQRQREDLVQCLVRNGACVNLCCKYWHPLHYAVSKGLSADIVLFLIDSGADLNATSPEGRNALHAISQETRSEVIKTLLNHEVNHNLPDIDKWRPLHLASMTGNIEGVKLLIEKGAFVNPCNRINVTPLHMAANLGLWEVSELLLHKGANVNKADDNLRTPLHYAALEGLDISDVVHYCDTEYIRSDVKAKIMTTLLQNGADINAQTRKKETALSIAFTSGEDELVKILLHKGANIDETYYNKLLSPNYEMTSNQCSAYAILKLHLALFKCIDDNNEHMLRACINHGTYLDCVSIKHGSPLLYACFKDRANIVDTLLSSGSNANYKTSAGITPLHYAARNGNVDVVISLLWHGSMLNVQNNRGQKPSYFARKANNVFISDLLQKLEQLFIFAQTGNHKILKTLTDLKNIYISKTTALGNKLNMSSELLGILRVRNKLNQTLVQTAVANKHTELAQSILEALQLK